MKIKVYGKINLALDVLGVKDNLHLLDMVTGSVNVYDIVTITPSSVMSCNLTDVVPMEKNSAYVAATRFAERFGTTPVDIHIEKHIPVMAGLGGSSADAGAVLFGMAKMFGITDNKALIEVALSVGSDVPLMMYGGYNRVSGLGDVITPIDSPITLDILTVMGNVGTSAKDVYCMFDKLKCPRTQSAIDVQNALVLGDKTALVSSLYNGLTKPAIHVNEQISMAMDYLNNCNADKVLLFGSGSAVGGIVPYNTNIDLESARQRFSFAELLTISGEYRTSVVE